MIVSIGMKRDTPDNQRQKEFDEIRQFRQWTRDTVALARVLLRDHMCEPVNADLFWVRLYGILVETGSFLGRAPMASALTAPRGEQALASMRSELTPDELLFIEVQRNSEAHIFTGKYYKLDRNGNPLEKRPATLQALFVDSTELDIDEFFEAHLRVRARAKRDDGTCDHVALARSFAIRLHAALVELAQVAEEIAIAV